VKPFLLLCRRLKQKKKFLNYLLKNKKMMTISIHTTIKNTKHNCGVFGNSMSIVI